MAKRPRVGPIEEFVQGIDEKLSRFRESANDLTLREQVLQLAAIQHDLRSLNVSACMKKGLVARGAMNRMLAYLQQHVGEVIAGAELEVVSGISEYARRLRQLRVERGYRIVTGAAPDPFSGVALHPDQYMLTTVDADTDTARRWEVANRIRKSAGSVKDRILAFFKENVGKVVTTEDLAYVAQNKREFGRRTRELRTEDGYAIATRMSGRPDLSVSEYMLLSLDRIAEPHDRYISAETQATVYARDHNRCRNPACNYQYTSSDPRILELHHIVPHAQRGSNNPDNLLVLCNICHDEIHADRLNILEIMFQGED
jgi:hypothetical protein